MSICFPNVLYMPTGLFSGADQSRYDYIQLSGYCFRRSASAVPLPADTFYATGDFISGYDDCDDCLECKCPTNIDFKFIGAYDPSGPDPAYVTSKTISLQVASTGWVEVAVPSGYLNQGTDLNPSGGGNFVASDIQCLYRKVDLDSGIHVSFENPKATLSRFSHSCDTDKFERDDLYGNLVSGFLTGTYGATPLGEYLNLFDSGNANTNIVKTIKFYHNCNIECNKKDIWFRLRGNVSEANYRKYGPNSSWNPDSWIYLACTGVPYTPGEIVDCIPSNTGSLNGKGISLNNYFESGDFKAGNFPTIQFMPKSIDVVNMPMLTGYEGSGTTKSYSVTGQYHFGVPTLEDPGSTAYPYSWVSYGGLYQGTPGYDFYGMETGKYLGSPKYSSGIGRFNYKYHFPANETGFVNSRDAVDRALNPPSEGTADKYQYDFGQSYDTMGLKPSEFADGLWKNGTYRPMIFTGIITGRQSHWDTFFGDRFNAEKRDNWETGVYVFQYYESGDAHRPNEIKGWWGLSSTGSGKFDHYRSKVENHSPVNMGNNLNVYSPRSGNFPNVGASLNNASIILNMGNPSLGNTPSDQGYQLPFSFNDGSFTFNYDMPFMELNENPFDDYEMNGVIISGNYPWYVHKTLVAYGTGDGARMSNLLLDSGNPAHNQLTSDPSNTFGTKFERIDGIRFVQKFK
jgi:hypothetical protein